MMSLTGFKQKKYKPTIIKENERDDDNHTI